MSIKQPTDVDHHVASRLKARRHEHGVTQPGLAAAVGVTFQQIQKYEKGTNRITAGCLYRIAKALDLPIGYFFEGLPEDTPTAVLEPAASREHVEREIRAQANVDAERRNARSRRDP